MSQESEHPKASEAKALYESGAKIREIARKLGLSRHMAAKLATGSVYGIQHADAPLRPEGVPTGFQNEEKIGAALRRTGLTLAQIAETAKVSPGAALLWIEQKQAAGFTIIERSGTFRWLAVAPPGNTGGQVLKYISRPDNTYVFGAFGDQHIGSKYYRPDVAEDLYDEFAKVGVDRVFNTGNWIDGEAFFNMFDLEAHGLDNQLRYLAERYPKRNSIHTYAVSGNDHEGWYNKKLGVEVGIYAERAMADAGRDDWHHIGFMQANVQLVNANTGKSATLTVMHPGGGTAYAISYKPQKIVEGFQGGEKPAVLLIGHYHKLSYNLIRNVHTLQTGCSQDQTPFMAQHLIEPHVGGIIVTLGQDPETGAITRCVPDVRNYFVREYYNNRWSMSHGVTLPDRGVA